MQFNRLWLDPSDPESFPQGLLEGLEGLSSSSSSGILDLSFAGISSSGKIEVGTAARLKIQMQADAIGPLDLVPTEIDEDDEGPLRMGTCANSDLKDPDEAVAVWPEDALLQVSDYLRLSVSSFHIFPSPTSI